MKNVPKLRFKGFSDEWEEKKLGDIVNSFEYGMNSPAVEYDGENKYIRITDIDEKTNRYINENVVSPGGELEDKYLVNENDILFARTGASTGKCYLYDKNDGKLYFAGFLIRANVNEENNAKFIFSQTKTNSYDKWVKIMSMRSGQPGINSQEYASYHIKIPSLKEQEKIANFLTKIDKLIGKQEEKVNNLAQYKKGIMQKIFSQEIRFKKADGGEYQEWGESNLSEIVEFFDNMRKPIKEGERKSGLYPYYGATGIIDYINDYIFDGEYLLLGEDGANIVTRNAPLIYKTSGKFWLNNHAHIFKTKSGYDMEFYKQYLETINYTKYNTGTAQPKLNIESVKKIQIKTLNLEEQIKIANFLSNIDSIVDKEKEKLEELRQWKKGLLQQMFV